ncbi:hypothetical protein [Dysgonomonas sp. ZJ709]|uniref:hypothetical protein n=1 Tax=Dysgonomonas sp. ZJ709 TaxID=2709797 RepID=UPI0013EDCB41|nr:hypothetical protein [Dysgonomonas sp. ZJ709]
MKIYSPNNILLIDIDVDDSSSRYKEIMGENILTLMFSLPNFIEIPEGSWCEFKAELYFLPKSQDFVQQHDEHFDYTLVMESSIMKLKATKFKFFTPIKNPGQPIKAGSSFNLKFSLNGTPAAHAQLLVDNLNLKYPGDNWTVGECIDSLPITIDYNHDLCFNVLSKTADAFNTEWEVENYKLHFRRVEKMRESAVDLSYGYDNGILGGITRTQFDDSKIINRVFIEGSDQNIDRSTYGNNTLLLPKNKTIVYEGISYRTDSSGSYVERVTPLPGSEDSLDITKIFPQRVGTVSAVEKINDAQGLYNIIDSSIPDSLDFSKSIIASETMTVIFQTGQLAGKEFDSNYIHASRRFELAPFTDSGQILPQGNIIPAIGDKYAVFHMRMPATYITEAETKALNEVVKYLWEGEQAQYTYVLPLDGIYAKREWGAIGGFLNCGYFIRFSSPQYQVEPVNIRIIAVEEYVNKPKSPKLTIANNVSGKSLGSVLNEIPTQETAVDRKDGAIREYARRRYRDVLEFAEAVKGMVDDFETDFISAAAFESLTYRAGVKSLQYQFLATNMTTVIEPYMYFDPATKTFRCDAVRFQHMTLGIDNVQPDRDLLGFKFWTAPAFTFDDFSEVNKPYYLYLNCSTTFSLVNGRNVGTANFFVSTEKIKINDVAGRTTLWVGLLSSENMDGDRSFRTVYGFTEILPGQITADTFLSADGKSFLKFLLNQFKFGNESSGIDWNVTKNNLLSIYNASITMYNTAGEKVIDLDGATGKAMFGKGAHVFNPDGSLSLASGNLLYDSINGLSITGKFTANNTDGSSSSLSPNKGFSIVKSNQQLISLYSSGSSNILDSQLMLRSIYTNTLNNIAQALLSSVALNLTNQENGNGFLVSTVGEKLIIRLGNVPTSPSGLQLGEIWRNGEDLKIII